MLEFTVTIQQIIIAITSITCIFLSFGFVKSVQHGQIAWAIHFHLAIHLLIIFALRAIGWLN